jgi:malonyl-CoA/methylmalonyl-CoA synthetase
MSQNRRVPCNAGTIPIADFGGRLMSNTLYDSLFGIHKGNSRHFLHQPGIASLSYADFLSRAARLAHALVARGLVPGDRVAVQVDKSPAALALYGACTQAGLVFLPLNTAYTATEVAYFVEDSAASLFVCDPARRTEMQPLADACGTVMETMAADGSGSLAMLAADCPDRFDTVARGAGDLAAILYTSGTTGRSKGAMMTNTNLLSNARTLVDLWRFTETDVLLHALPIFHTHGLFVATNVMLLAGGSMIFLPKFDAGQVITALPRATAMMGVPTFYTRLLDDPRFTREVSAHMRLFISGSAPLLEETHSRFQARTGHRILERYGMTETNMITSNPYDAERRAGTVGFPLPGVEVKITDPESGALVQQGKIGQIEVRGANVFKGYWRMPEKTAQELRTDGYFITGDLGRVDRDGYVSIVGRGKDLIISGGYNIYPKEVETLLDAQPGVLESAVIGVAHRDFGETVVAVLVADRGTAPDLDAIEANLARDLAAFKRPRRLIVVDELPRNAMGKVQKNQLRDTWGGLFS